jgi:hypothetical protein
MNVPAVEVAARHVVVVVVVGTNVAALVPVHVVDIPRDEKVLVATVAVELTDDDAWETLDERHEGEACWKQSPPSVGRHSTPVAADAASLELAEVAYQKNVVSVAVGSNISEEV